MALSVGGRIVRLLVRRAADVASRYASVLGTFAVRDGQLLIDLHSDVESDDASTTTGELPLGPTSGIAAKLASDGALCIAWLPAGGAGAEEARASFPQQVRKGGGARLAGLRAQGAPPSRALVSPHPLSSRASHTPTTTLAATK